MNQVQESIYNKTTIYHNNQVGITENNKLNENHLKQRLN